MSKTKDGLLPREPVITPEEVKRLLAEGAENARALRKRMDKMHHIPRWMLKMRLR